MKKLLSNSNLQILLSILAIGIIWFDAMISNHFHQEFPFTIFSTCILILNISRHKLEINKIVKIISIISVLGFLAFAFSMTVLFSWGMAFTSGKAPVLLNVALITIIFFVILIAWEILVSIIKTTNKT